MDLFLDTCIIISYHIPCHPHHKKVLNFYNNNNINSQITCKKVERELSRKLNKILMEFKKSNSISGLEERKVRHAISIFFRKIQSQDFSILDSFLFNDLEIDLRKVIKNWDDREVFSNAVLWCYYHKPNNPTFLTLDKNDYHNILGIKGAVYNCLSKNNVSLHKQLDIFLLL